MNDGIMIKISANDNSFALRTKSRMFQSPQQFYLLKKELDQLEKQRFLISSDIYSFAKLHLCKTEDEADILKIDFSWLSGNGYGTLTGCQEVVSIPYDCFRELAVGSTRKVLSSSKKKSPRIEFQSMRNLKQIVEIPLLRKKLGKFLNQHFNWFDYERIVITDDPEPYSFMFYAYSTSVARTCGGIILHGRNDLKKAYYGMHT